MLVDPESPQWNDPPAAVTAFVQQTADALGDDWHVQLRAFDNEVCDNPAQVSAAIDASNHQVQPGIHVAISRHAGTDSVLVRIGTMGPFPFEDLAVATGLIQEEHLLERVQSALDEMPPQPLLPFDDVLQALVHWSHDLPHVDQSSLDAIAAKVAKAFEDAFAPPDH